MTRKNIAVTTIALTLALVACGKKTSAKKAALPAAQQSGSTCPAAPAALASTGNAPLTVLSGSWSTPCLTADQSWYGSPEIHTIAFNGNVLVETVVSYSDASCKTKVGCPDIGQSHFDFGGTVDENNFNMSYSDGDFKSVTDEVITIGNDGTISFSDEPAAFSQVSK